MKKVGTVRLMYIPEAKVETVKAVRALTSLGLRQSKELVDSAPVVVSTNVTAHKYAEVFDGPQRKKDAELCHAFQWKEN